MTGDGQLLGFEGYYPFGACILSKVGKYEI